MGSLADLPWIGAAVKLFIAALLAPVWWPVLVEVRAEIQRSSKTSRERKLKPKRLAQGFVAQLHGEPARDIGAARGTSRGAAGRATRARRSFRAAR
jgi:hypothetical protein